MFEKYDTCGVIKLPCFVSFDIVKISNKAERYEAHISLMILICK